MLSPATLFCILAGCQPASTSTISPSFPDSPAEGPDEVAAGTIGQAEELESLELQWTAAEVESRLASVESQGLVSPRTVDDAFQALVVGAAGDGCFNAETNTEGWLATYFDGECTTENGRSFDGGWIYLWQNTRSEGGLETYVADALASLSMSGEAHEGLEAGGNWLIMRSRTNDGQRIIAQLGGTYQSSESGPGLSLGLSAGLDWDILASNEERVATLEGSMSYADEIDLYFAGVTFDFGLCGGAPIGVVQIRDPSTAWISLEFTDDCEPCPEGRVGERSLGPVCAGEALQRAAVRTLSLELEAP
jgi:hypothetical protein